MTMLRVRDIILGSPRRECAVLRHLSIVLRTKIEGVSYDNTKRLSNDCITQLKYIAELFKQIDGLPAEAFYYIEACPTWLPHEGGRDGETPDAIITTTQLTVLENFVSFASRDSARPFSSLHDSLHYLEDQSTTSKWRAVATCFQRVQWRMHSGAWQELEYDAYLRSHAKL